MSAWLDFVRAEMAQDERQLVVATEVAYRALQTADTNALPNLVKWIDTVPPESNWRERFQKIAEFWPFSRSETFVRWAHDDRNSAMVRCAAAMWAFRLLGTNAAAAIPSLVGMTNSDDLNAAWRAAEAIRCAKGETPTGQVLTQPRPNRGRPR